MKRKRSKISKIRKFLGKIFWVDDLEIEKKHPKCFNDNVYDEFHPDEVEYLVNGEKTKKRLYCIVARTISTNRFHCCEKSGKYFEEDK
jgi:hypothetical protein